MAPSGIVGSTTQANKGHTSVSIERNGKAVPESLDSDDPDSVEDIDRDYGSYHDHVFSDPKVAAYWANAYENARYEGRHRFDPEFTWSATEEKRLKRKLSGLITLAMNFADAN